MAVTEVKQTAPATTPPQDSPKKKRRALYDFGVSKGFYDDTFEAFEQKFSDPVLISKLYGAIKEQGGDEVTISEQDFTSKYFGDIYKDVPALDAEGNTTIPIDTELPVTPEKEEIAVPGINPYIDNIPTQAERPDLYNEHGLTTDPQLNEALARQYHDQWQLEGYAQKNDSGQGRLMSALNTFSESFTRPLTVDLLRTFAIGGKEAGEMLGLTDEMPLDETPVGRYVKQLDSDIEELFPENPRFQNEFLTAKFPQGLGSAASFALSGGITNAITKPAKAVGLLNTASKVLTSPGTLVGGSSIASNEYQQAIDSGASDEEAFQTFLLNLPLGATEAIPIAKMFRRIDQTTGGGIKNVLVGGFKGGVEELIQEVLLQQLPSNYIASEIYDETRRLTEGLKDAGEVGFATGFALNALGLSLKNLRNSANPDQQAGIDKSLEFLEQQKANTPPPGDTGSGPSGGVIAPKVEFSFDQKADAAAQVQHLTAERARLDQQLADYEAAGGADEQVMQSFMGAFGQIDQLLSDLQSTDSVVEDESNTDSTEPAYDYTARSIPSLLGEFVDYGGIKGRVIETDYGYGIEESDGSVSPIEGGASGENAGSLGISYAEPVFTDDFDWQGPESEGEAEQAGYENAVFDPENNTINLYGKEFTYEAVETDADGVTTSIRVADENGNTRYLRNPDTVLEIEIQKILWEEQNATNWTEEDIDAAANKIGATQAEPALETESQGEQGLEQIQQGRSVTDPQTLEELAQKEAGIYKPTKLKERYEWVDQELLNEFGKRHTELLAVWEQVGANDLPKHIQENIPLHNRIFGYHGMDPAMGTLSRLNKRIKAQEKGYKRAQKEGFSESTEESRNELLERITAPIEITENEINEARAKADELRIARNERVSKNTAKAERLRLVSEAKQPIANALNTDPEFRKVYAEAMAHPKDNFTIRTSHEIVKGIYEKDFTREDAIDAARFWVLLRDIDYSMVGGSNSDPVAEKDIATVARKGIDGFAELLHEKGNPALRAQLEQVFGRAVDEGLLSEDVYDRVMGRSDDGRRTTDDGVGKSEKGEVKSETEANEPKTVLIDEFLSGLDPMRKGRVQKTLNSNIALNRVVKTRREHIEELIGSGATIGTFQGKATINKPDGSFIFQKDVGKTAMDYAKFLLENKNEGPKAGSSALLEEVRSWIGKGYDLRYAKGTVTEVHPTENPNVVKYVIEGVNRDNEPFRVTLHANPGSIDWTKENNLFDVKGETSIPEKKNDPIVSNPAGGDAPAGIGVTINVDELSRSAKQHVKETAGVAYEIKPGLGIVQGFNPFGQPVYVAFKGNDRTRVDIESYTGDAFTDEEKTQLVALKKHVEDTERISKVTDPFKEQGRVAGSDSVSNEVKGFVESLTASLGIEDNIFIITDSDFTKEQYDKHGLYDDLAPVRSAKLSSGNQYEFGAKRYMREANAFYIYYEEQLKGAQLFTIISHEVGHIVEQRLFDTADNATKASIEEDYNKWYAGLKGKTLSEVVEETRDITIHDLFSKNTRPFDRSKHSYISSFREYFADNVAKWARTSTKPKGLVEQFFQSIIEQLKKIHNYVYNTGNYSQNLFNWLDEIYTPGVTTTEKGPVSDSKNEEIEVKRGGRTLDENGRPSDGKPILPGDIFKTASGRNTTPYPKYSRKKSFKRDRLAASEWLIKNAVAEATARGDEWNARIFKNTHLLSDGTLTGADAVGMELYVFGDFHGEINTGGPEYLDDPMQRRINAAIAVDFDAFIEAEKALPGAYDPDTSMELIREGFVDSVTANKADLTKIERALSPEEIKGEWRLLQRFFEREGLRIDNDDAVGRIIKHKLPRPFDFVRAAKIAGVIFKEADQKEEFRASSVAEALQYEEVMTFTDGIIESFTIDLGVPGDLGQYRRMLDLNVLDEVIHGLIEDFVELHTLVDKQLKVIQNLVSVEFRTEVMGIITGYKNEMTDPDAPLNNIRMLYEVSEVMELTRGALKAGDMDAQIKALKDVYSRKGVNNTDTDSEAPVKELSPELKVLQKDLSGKLPKKADRIDASAIGEFIPAPYSKPPPQKKWEKEDPITIAVSSDYLRPAMNGVLYDVENKVRVATDGHVLVVDPLKKAVNKTRVKDPKSGDIIKDDYPNWKAVVPRFEEYPYRVSVTPEMEELLLSNARFNRFINDDMRVLIKSADGVTVIFKNDVMERAVRAMKGLGVKNIHLFFSEPTRAAVLVDANNPKRYALVMPYYYSGEQMFTAHNYLAKDVPIYKPNLRKRFEAVQDVESMPEWIDAMRKYEKALQGDDIAEVAYKRKMLLRIEKEAAAEARTLADTLGEELKDGPGKDLPMVQKKSLDRIDYVRVNYDGRRARLNDAHYVVGGERGDEYYVSNDELLEGYEYAIYAKGGGLDSMILQGVNDKNQVHSLKMNSYLGKGTVQHAASLGSNLNMLKYPGRPRVTLREYIVERWGEQVLEQRIANYTKDPLLQSVRATEGKFEDYQESLKAYIGDEAIYNSLPHTLKMYLFTSDLIRSYKISSDAGDLRKLGLYIAPAERADIIKNYVKASEGLGYAPYLEEYADMKSPADFNTKQEYVNYMTELDAHNGYIQTAASKRAHEQAYDAYDPDTQANEADGEHDMLGFIAPLKASEGEKNMTGARVRRPSPVPEPSDIGPDLPVATSVREIAEEFKRRSGITVRQGRITNRKALGIYYGGTGVIRTRIVKSLGVLVHEAGHDFHYNNKGEVDRLIAQHATEVEPLAYDGTPKGKERIEGFAEFVRLYATNPLYARNAAPNFYETFEGWLESKPKYKDALQYAQVNYSAWLRQPSKEASASQITMPGNEESDLARSIKEQDVTGFFDVLRTTWNTVIRRRFDFLHPVKMAVNQLKDIHEENTGERLTLKAVNDAYKLSRLSLDAYTAGQMDVEHGVYNYDTGRSEGPSVVDALHYAFDGKFTDQKILDFGTYLADRRIVHEYNRYFEGEIPNPPSKLSQADHEQSIADFESAYPKFEQAAELVYDYNSLLWKKQFEAGLITLEQYALGLHKHPDYVPLMRDMRDQSRVLNARKKDNHKYSVIKTFRGSDRDIINPIVSIIEQTYRINHRIRHNDVRVAIARLARRIGRNSGRVIEPIPNNELQGYRVESEAVLKALSRQMDWDAFSERDAIDIANHLAALDEFDLPGVTLFKRGEINEKGEPIIYTWEQGVRRAYRLADGEFGIELYKALTQVGKETAGTLMNALSFPSTLLRTGVTTSPEFVIANLSRDQLSAWILTDSGYTPFVSAASGLKSELKQDDFAHAYRYFSGLSTRNSAAVSREYFDKEIKRLRHKNIVVRRLKSLKGFAELTDLSETGTRIGLFKATARTLMDKHSYTYKEAMTEAAFVSRDLIDFGMHGSRMVGARRVFTFLNATLQSLYKAERVLISAEGARSRVLRNRLAPYFKTVNEVPLSLEDEMNLSLSRKAWVKIMSIAAFSTALSLMYKDDPEYEEISNDLRAMHWVFKLPGDSNTGLSKWVAFPKPFELAFIANVAEQAVIEAGKDRPDFIERLIADNYQLIAPPVNNPGVNVLVEQFANKRVYDGRPVVDPSSLGVENYLQFNEYTSDFSRKLGEITEGTKFELSPARVDHVITGLTGSWGRNLLAATNQVGVNDPAKGIDDRGFVRRFVKSSDRGSNSEAVFWEQLREGGTIAAKYSSFLRIINTGLKGEDATYLSKQDDYAKAYLTMRYLRSMHKGVYGKVKQHPLDIAANVAGHTREIREGLRENDVLTAKQKRDLDDVLDRLQTAYYRNALIASGHEQYRNREPYPIDEYLNTIRTLDARFFGDMNKSFRGKNLDINPSSDFESYKQSYELNLPRWESSVKRILNRRRP